MRKTYNFSAGPSMLPESVLETARDELLDYHGSGVSVMEMSHRSPEFVDIIEHAEMLLRKIMTIPEQYYVLFLQGGATSQFAMVPMNLMSRKGKADYINSGSFAGKAIGEAEKYGRVSVVASSEAVNFTEIPEIPAKRLDPDADYLHFTMNNTIYGTRFTSWPETAGVPLVSDVSSCILSQPLDVSRFGLIYAGAQKNVAPSGLTIVIVRKDLTGNPLETTPAMFDYRIHADKKSMFNTPPCFNIYLAGLVFQWILDQGGLEEIEVHNRRKAGLLYDFIDSSKLYSATVKESDRSMMNVTFVLEREELTPDFLEKAGTERLLALKGHRSVGGLRASIYNAMPLEGVKALVHFMERYEGKRG